MNQATSVKPTPVITLISDVCREILANRTSLPSMPDVAARIHGAMQNPNWSVTTVAAIIKGDPGTTAYLLQIANSALYFGVTPILEVERAMARIGVDSTRNLIMAHTLRSTFKTPSKLLGALMRRTWQTIDARRVFCTTRAGTADHDVRIRRQRDQNNDRTRPASEHSFFEN